MAAHLAFRNLLSLLPDLEVLEGLRFALARHALSDPVHAWSDVENASTIDVRVLDREAVREAVREAAEDARREVEEVYAAIGGVLAAALDGRPDAAEQLIAAGDERENASRFSAALRFFQAAHEASLPLGDRHAQIVALRRIGRLRLAAGEVVDAEQHYRRSAELARDTGATREEVIARTGVGNTLMRVGRWADAETCYMEALELAGGDEVRRERAQLMINLAQSLAHQGRFAEAESWLSQADQLWTFMDAPAERAVWGSVRAHILDEQGQLEAAVEEYMSVLAYDPPPLLRALFAIDLADVLLRLGRPSEARYWGREAEQSALAGGSVGYLTEVYRGLGNIERDTDGEAVALYEKSLEIARKNGLRLSEAQTLGDFAKLQKATGNGEEGRAFIEHALSIFDELGATEEARKAREELAAPGYGDPEPISYA